MVDREKIDHIVSELERLIRSIKKAHEISDCELHYSYESDAKIKGNVVHRKNTGWMNVDFKARILVMKPWADKMTSIKKTYVMRVDYWGCLNDAHKHTTQILAEECIKNSNTHTNS